MKQASFINILQITDIHLSRKEQGRIYGVETQILFEKILEQVKQELVTTDTRLDVVLATGDISQDGSTDSYRRFHDFMKNLGVPCYFLQGNHDDHEPMLKEFGSDRVAPCQVEKTALKNSPWKILLLNSSLENQVGGHFGAKQLTYLQNALSSDSKSPTLICFHHHPLVINSDWLDQQVIDNADDFFKVIDKFTNVKLSIYGHVHQERKTLRNNVAYFATPSTCVQFVPESHEFALDDKEPAYRLIRLYNDGHFETEVVCLKNTK